MHRSPLASALRRVTQHPPIGFRNIMMVPLLEEVDRARGAGRRGHGRPGPATSDDAPYLMLDTALANGWTEITEVSEAGRVPELRVVNRAPRPVLIVDGEELVGARQDRIVNLTILVPAQSTMTIPVSCVEAGRWRQQTRRFAAAPRTQFAAGRSRRVAQVTRAFVETGSRLSNQAEVWEDIATASVRLGVDSATFAMKAMFSARAPDIEPCVAALAPVPHQVGAVFLVDGRIAGVDLFDRPSTLRALLPKLVRAVAIDALDTPRGERQADAAATLVRMFLATVADRAVHAAPALGLGEDLRLTGADLAGAALVVDGAVIHACAFVL